MILVGATAAFLPGTYPDAEEVPDRERVIEELASFIHFGLRPRPNDGRNITTVRRRHPAPSPSGVHT